MKWRWMAQVFAIYLFFKYVLGIDYIYLPSITFVAIVIALCGVVVGVLGFLVKDLPHIGPD